jgi:glycosyltransferase involved in cell wall biosynthesis
MAAGLPCPYPANLSLCLPAFNEEAVIGEIIRSAQAVLEVYFADYEILVVDDGSQDKTAGKVLEHVRTDSRVRLLRHEKNIGYGGAVRTGLRQSRGDLVMFMDSDGQFDLLELPRLLAHIQQYDWVVGYRQSHADSAQRRFNAWCWSKLVSLLLNVSMRDLDCAFKLFRRDTLDMLDLSSTGSCINAEILAQCVRNGLKFHEVPVTHLPRLHGKQTGASLRVIYRAFRELLTLWKFRCPRRILKHTRARSMARNTSVVAVSSRARAEAVRSD